MQKRTLASKLVAGALIFSLGTTALPSFYGVNAVSTVAAATYTKEDAFAFDAASGYIIAYKGADQIVNIPEKIGNDTVTGIEWGAFSDSTITQITMPAFVTTIGSMAFEGCNKLTSIEMSNNIQVIAPYTFYGCTELTKVTLPSSTTEIMLEAFSGCTKLKEITIPASVTTIDEEAFLNCNELTILGVKDSYAETFAQKANIAFEEIAKTDDDKDDSQNGTDDGKDNTPGSDDKDGNQSGNDDDKDSNQGSNDNDKDSNQSGNDDGKDGNQDGNDDDKDGNQRGNDDGKDGNQSSNDNDKNNNPDDNGDNKDDNQSATNTDKDGRQDDNQNSNPDENALAAAKDKAAADTVSNQIAQLGIVSVNSKSLLEAVRIAYDALTFNQKLLVTNYEVLTNAETTYAKLIASGNIPATNGSVLSLNSLDCTLYTSGKRYFNLEARENNIPVDASKVNWVSSNPNIATVNSGSVTAKALGSATITATYNGLTTTCTVTVKKPTLKLQKKKITLSVKKKFKINALAVPTGKVTYKSNNKKVAVVSKNGKITAKSTGKARITVTANGIKKRLMVTVK